MYLMKIMLKIIINKIKLFSDWNTLYILNVCPHCNSDAPEIDNCPICTKSKQGRLRPYKSEDRDLIWENYKQLKK